LNILFVDDEDVIRNSCALALEKEGHKVWTAKNGLEAIFIFENNPSINCIVLDLTMPRLAGYDTFLELRKINSTVKIILISGYDVDMVALRHKELNYYSYLQKPFSIERLLIEIG